MRTRGLHALSLVLLAPLLVAAGEAAPTPWVSLSLLGFGVAAIGLRWKMSADQRAYGEQLGRLVAADAHQAELVRDLQTQARENNAAFRALGESFADAFRSATNSMLSAVTTMTDTSRSIAHEAIKTATDAAKSADKRAADADERARMVERRADALGQELNTLMQRHIELSARFERMQDDSRHMRLAAGVDQ